MAIRVRKTGPTVKAKAKAKVAPWMVVRHPDGQPAHASTFKEARAVIERDVARFRRLARELYADDMMQAVDRLHVAASRLSPNQSGSQFVEGHLPTPAGGKVKYRAELWRRDLWRGDLWRTKDAPERPEEDKD